MRKTEIRGVADLGRAKSPKADASRPLPRRVAEARVGSAGLGPGPRVGDRRQDRLDLGAQVLERRREDERLAEVIGILVHREARAERRESKRTPLGSRK